MRSAAVEIVARGGVVGDRWRGELVVPTPGGAVRIGAEVTDADVRSLLGLLRGAHRALHALDDATRAQLVARQELAHRAALAQGAEVGVWPLVAAIAIPLLTAAAGYGVQATTPGFGGRTPSGATVTTFAGSPVDETPREGGPSVEEVRALWAARGADRPDDIIAEHRTPDGMTVPAQVWTNPMRRLRDVALEWLGAYHRGYFGTVYERADQVPAQVRAAWVEAQRQGVPLWRTLGLAGPPASPVPVGQPLAGSSLLASGYTPTAPWAQGSLTPEAGLMQALAAAAQGAAGGGISWQQAIGRLLPALTAAASQGGSPQAAQAMALLSQLAPMLGALGGAQQPGATTPGANPLAGLAGLLGGAQQPGAGQLAPMLAGLLGSGQAPPQLAGLLGQLGASQPGSATPQGLAALLGSSGLLGAGSQVAPGAPQLATAQGALASILGGAPPSTATSSPLLASLLGVR